MALQALYFVLGLVALYYGAEWLVRGAGRLARSLGVSALVVGLTVVAFGTSAPELVVSVLAALEGRSDVAMGNVVGSNIANIALILGVAAVIYPMRVEAGLVRREIPVMIAVQLLLVLLALNRSLGRLDGVLLMAGLVAYNVWVLRSSKATLGTEPAVEAEFSAFESADAIEPLRNGRGRNAMLIVLGLAALVLGAQLLVDAAVFFARTFGVSELVIGLTVVAVGTSLPELATSVLAALRHEADIAVGNVVGSNIFNALGILGVAATVQPITVAEPLLRLDLPVMIAVCLALLPLAARRLRLGRGEGLLLLGGYVAFTVVLLWRQS